MADKTETEAAAEFFTARGVQFDRQDIGNIAVLPDGYSVHSLEEFQAQPNRVRSKHSFSEVVSLATYVNRFGVDATMISADYAAATIKAVIDGDDPTEGAGFGAHTATFKAALDDRLAAWMNLKGGISQIALGRFLESRAVDVQKPDAATVMEMIMTFDAVKKVNFKSAVRLHDGLRQLVYTEDNEARGAVTVPDHFILFLPVYRGLDPQPIKFWLRYRIEEGALTFTVEMHDRAEVLREAFGRCIDQFRVGTTKDWFVYVTA